VGGFFGLDRPARALQGLEAGFLSGGHLFLSRECCVRAQALGLVELGEPGPQERSPLLEQACRGEDVIRLLEARLRRFAAEPRGQSQLFSTQCVALGLQLAAVAGLTAAPAQDAPAVLSGQFCIEVSESLANFSTTLSQLLEVSFRLPLVGPTGQGAAGPNIAILSEPGQGGGELFGPLGELDFDHYREHADGQCAAVRRADASADAAIIA
jgi:hypothetical protein